MLLYLLELLKREKRRLTWFQIFFYTIVLVGLARSLQGILGFPLAIGITSTGMLLLYVVIPAIVEEPVKLLFYRKLQLASGIKLAIMYQVFESFTHVLTDPTGLPAAHAISRFILPLLIGLHVILFLIAALDGFSLRITLLCILLHAVNNFFYWGMFGWWSLWLGMDMFASSKLARGLNPYFALALYSLALISLIRHKKELLK